MSGQRPPAAPFPTGAPHARTSHPRPHSPGSRAAAAAGGLWGRPLAASRGAQPKVSRWGRPGVQDAARTATPPPGPRAGRGLAGEGPRPPLKVRRGPRALTRSLPAVLRSLPRRASPAPAAAAPFVSRTGLSRSHGPPPPSRPPPPPRKDPPRPLPSNPHRPPTPASPPLLPPRAPRRFYPGFPPQVPATPVRSARAVHVQTAGSACPRFSEPGVSRPQAPVLPRLPGALPQPQLSAADSAPFPWGRSLSPMDARPSSRGGKPGRMGTREGARSSGGVTGTGAPGACVPACARLRPRMTV